MVAYMNRDALLETLERRRGVFFSRSRNKLWRKGEESGNHQEVHSIALDCDKDCILDSRQPGGGRRLSHGTEILFFSPGDPGQSPRVIVNKWTYRFQPPQRGDIVSFPSPAGGKGLVKRVVAVAGEKVPLEAQASLY
jgi:hypothetical protein